jgi:hypothetical protein
MNLHGVNWGQINAWAGIALSTGAAIGYACAKDWRNALYFAFAAMITTTVIWGR